MVTCTHRYSSPENPQLFPEFAQMLTSYWELHYLLTQFVDDPEYLVLGSVLTVLRLPC